MIDSPPLDWSILNLHIFTLAVSFIVSYIFLLLTSNFLFQLEELPFSISFKARLEVVKFLSFCLSFKIFISLISEGHSFSNKVFLFGSFCSLSSLNMLLHLFIAWIFSPKEIWCHTYLISSVYNVRPSSPPNLLRFSYYLC